MAFRPLLANSKKLLLKNSITLAVQSLNNTHIKTLATCGTAVALSLSGANSYGASLSFQAIGDGAVVNLFEPPADAQSTINIGPVLTSNFEDWRVPCTVTGRVVITGPAEMGSDYRVNQELEFTLNTVPNIADEAQAKSSAQRNSKPFDQVSQDIEFEVLEDFEVEELETLELRFADVSASCGEVDVTDDVLTTTYGSSIAINDTFNEQPDPDPDPDPDPVPDPEPDPEPPRGKELPAVQRSLKTHADDMSVLTLHTSTARNRSISKEIRRARKGLGGFNAENLQVSIGGTHVPKMFLQPELYDADYSGEGGAGAGDPVNDFGNWGFFVSGSIDIGERKEASGGSDYDSSLLILGVDYLVNNNLVLGGALSQTRLETELDSNAAATEFDRTSYSIFASYYQDDKFYVDLITSYGTSDYNLSRTIVSDSATADTDGDELSVALGGGLNFNFSSLDLSVFSTLNYVDSGINAYTETATGTASAASVNDISLKSLTANIGLDFSWHINTKVGVISPQFSLAAEHQFEDDAIDVNGNFIGGATPGEFEFESEKLDSNYFSSQLGLTAAFKGGFTTYITYDTYIDRDDLSSHNYSLGARWQF